MTNAERGSILFQKSSGIWISITLGIAEMMLLCMALVGTPYGEPIPVMLLMAAASGYALSLSNLHITFLKLQSQLPPDQRPALARTAFFRLHDMLLSQSVLTAVAFFWVGSPVWCLVCVCKLGLLWLLSRPIPPN